MTPVARLILAWLLALAMQSPTTADETATLSWTSGDSLTGTLVSADGQTLVWQSPLFVEPLQIGLSSLSMVKYPTPATSEAALTVVPTDPFRVLLRNGDVLTGALVELADETVTLDSVRFGRVGIARSSILSLQRSANDSGLIYSGLRGLDGWQPAFRRSANQAPHLGGGLFMVEPGGQADENASGDAVPPHWTVGLDNSVQTKKPGAAIFLPLELTDRFEIDVELASTKTLAFTMAVGRDARDGLRVETWVDVLVAANGTAFDSLMPLPGDGSSLQLHLFGDYRAGTLQVFARSGEKLGEISTNGLRGGPEGLLFRNGDFDLSIRRLRVSRWDGRTPQISDGEGVRVQLVDGTSRSGQLVGLDAAAGQLQFRGAPESFTVAVSDIDSLLFDAQDSAVPPDRGPCQIVWQDGATVSGELVRIDRGGGTIQPGYCAQPIVCALDQVARIGLPGQPIEPSARDQQDRLFHASGSLGGQLLVDGAAEQPIRWTPAGGQNAVALRSGDVARFHRASGIRFLSEDAELQQTFPDVVTLKTGDVLPCRFTAVDDTTARLTLPFSDVRELPVSALLAVELGTSQRQHRTGFGDSGWKGRRRLVKGESDESELLTSRSRVVQHPDILSGDTVRFHVAWPEQSYGYVTVSMFGPPGNKVGATHVTFVLSPGQMQVDDKVQTDRAVMFGGFNRNHSDSVVRTPKCEADIELVARDGVLKVLANGSLASTIPLNPAGASSRQLSFCGEMQALGQVVGEGGAREPVEKGIKLTKFEVDTTSGASIRQFIHRETRDAAMRVPRFRRDNPPTHVLLAPNGDVLRGKLLEMTESQVVFESRLEPLRLDRQRVAAILWVAPPAAADAAVAEDESAFVMTDEDQPPMLAQLTDGFRISLTPERLVDGRIVGRSDTLGTCSFPASSIRELFVGAAEGRDVQDAWDQWVAQHAPEPDWDIPQADGGNSAGSDLIGKPSPEFELPLLGGGTFKPSDHRGKVVVLDFWATWCGPCVAAMPEYVAATSAFDSGKVIFVAVNQQEASDVIREFLAEQQLSPTVALDRDGVVASQFGVSGIPHMVVLGPDGTVEDVHVGYQAGSGEALQIALQQMLDGTWKRPEPEPADAPVRENQPAI